MYQESADSLDGLLEQLKALAKEVPTANNGKMPHQTQLLRESLSEYVAVLEKAIIDLRAICGRLLDDEEAYRFTPPAEQSEFNKDIIPYDRELLALEKVGARLNKLFAGY